MDTILHNQPEGTPSDNELIAYGTPTTPAGNIKLSNFYNLLMGKLGFFKVSNLFSEIFGNPTSMASARANLSVPSVSDMQTADNLKANKSNVIEKDSTVDFTPTIGTHPVNKKYVDNKFISGRTLDLGEPSGNQTFVIPIGQTLSNTNYKVFITMIGNSTAMYAYSVINKTTTTFSIHTDEDAGVNQGNFYFDWLIIT